MPDENKIWFSMYRDGDGNLVDFCKEPTGERFTKEHVLYQEFLEWNSVQEKAFDTTDKIAGTVPDAHQKLVSLRDKTDLTDAELKEAVLSLIQILT